MTMLFEKVNQIRHNNKNKKFVMKALGSFTLPLIYIGYDLNACIPVIALPNTSP